MKTLNSKCLKHVYSMIQIENNSSTTEFLRLILETSLIKLTKMLNKYLYTFSTENIQFKYN